MSPELRTEHRQSQTLSPRLQHAVRLLQMSSLDFAALVRDKLDSNPFLEGEESDDGVGAADDGTDGGAAAPETAAPAEVPVVEADERGADRDLWQMDEIGRAHV